MCIQSNILINVDIGCKQLSGIESDPLVDCEVHNQPRDLTTRRVFLRFPTAIMEIFIAIILFSTAFTAVNSLVVGLGKCPKIPEFDFDPVAVSQDS